MDYKDRKIDIIGRVERVSFPEIIQDSLHARVDTGAQTSSIWAKATEKNGELHVVFFGPEHPAYSGKVIVYKEFTDVIVASSTGHTQHRYKVRILININGRLIRARFTLADRSTQVYPVLIGRNILKGKFVVDVDKGHPLITEEKKRSKKLQAKLEEK